MTERERKRQETTQLLLDYEISNSFWARLISSPRMRNIAAMYFTRLVLRKQRQMDEFRAFKRISKSLKETDETIE